MSGLSRKQELAGIKVDDALSSIECIRDDLVFGCKPCVSYSVETHHNTSIGSYVEPVSTLTIRDEVTVVVDDIATLPMVVLAEIESEDVEFRLRNCVRNDDGNIAAVYDCAIIG